MIAIKFSHHYKKMPAVLSPTFIRGIKKVHFSELTPEFIKADTETDDGQFYPLPRTWLIIISLWTEGREWQTIRRFTPEKMEYYDAHIGNEVEIKIEEIKP